MMDDLEARVRCLELAVTCNKAVADHSAEGVVNMATLLYAFAKASPSASASTALVETESVDKPKRGRPPRQADLFS